MERLEKIDLLTCPVSIPGEGSTVLPDKVVLWKTTLRMSYEGLEIVLSLSHVHHRLMTSQLPRTIRFRGYIAKGKAIAVTAKFKWEGDLFICKFPILLSQDYISFVKD